MANASDESTVTFGAASATDDSGGPRSAPAPTSNALAIFGGDSASEAEPESPSASRGTEVTEVSGPRPSPSSRPSPTSAPTSHGPEGRNPARTPDYPSQTTPNTPVFCSGTLRCSNPCGRPRQRVCNRYAEGGPRWGCTWWWWWESWNQPIRESQTPIIHVAWVRCSARKKPSFISSPHDPMTQRVCNRLSS